MKKRKSHRLKKFVCNYKMYFMVTWSHIGTKNSYFTSMMTYATKKYIILRNTHLKFVLFLHANG